MDAKATLRVLVVAVLAGSVHIAVAASAPGNPEAGKKWFMESCQHCHGQKGDSRREMAAYLTPPPADLTSKATRSKTDAQLRKVISEGKAGTSMASFGQAFQDAQLDDLIAFLRSLK